MIGMYGTWSTRTLRNYICMFKNWKPFICALTADKSRVLPQAFVIWAVVGERQGAEGDGAEHTM